MSPKQAQQFKTYGYRWAILTVYALINAVMQIQWLTFAPIAREAQKAYAATPMEIDLLSMVFMLIFLVMCIPASYILDRYGLRKGVGVGAVLVGVFGLMKGVFAGSYTMVFIAQVGLAVAQPFIMNSATKVAVHWFPINERATAVGVATLSQFLGMIVVMIATPLMITQVGATYDLGGMLLAWGAVSALGALALVVFLREYPPTPAGPESGEDRLLTAEGLKRIFRHRDMLLAILMFFIGLGIFNAVATCIDQVSEIKGFTMEQSGMIMGLMLIAGIFGAVIFPPMSDHMRKRKPLLVLGTVLLTPGLLGLAIAGSYEIMLATSALVGAFLLGTAGPIGFQYVAEVSYPAPESLSQGIVLLAGQISGIIFIVLMNTVGMIESLYIFAGLAALTIIITLLMKESPRILTDTQK